MWERLCRVLGAEQLATDPRFTDNAARVKNRRELEAILQDLFRRESTEHWMRALEAAGIPAGPVHTYDAVFADPQTLARHMVVPVKHPTAGETRLLGIPVKLSETPGAIRAPAPRLGEHTAEILDGLNRGGGERRAPHGG